jgi:thiol:disulfide interchange protein
MISSVVASVTAIPCTAPFLGTAAAFALQETLPKMLVIFLAIATGFSLPYLVALFIPLKIPQQLMKYSNIAKRIIELGIGGTFGWIVALLSNHISTLMLLIYVLLLALSGILFRKRRNILATMLLLMIFVPTNGEKTAGIVSNNGAWKKCERADFIDRDLVAKRIVIFNISADWCLSCKYNKHNVLGDDKVLALIKDKNVLCLEGDMTQKNDNLMHFIHWHHRVGIPFTIIYGPGARDGILLAELPSVEDTVDAIKIAAGDTTDGKLNHGAKIFKKTAK